MSGSQEVAMCSVNAVLLTYATDQAKWVPQGPGNGMSRIYLYKNESPKTYRIVSRNAQDKSVNCNSMLSKTTTYNKATDVFHQWRDVRAVYGISFPVKTEAIAFGEAVDTALVDLQGAEPPVAPTPPPPVAAAPPAPAPVLAKPPIAAAPPRGPPPPGPPPNAPPPGPPPAAPPAAPPAIRPPVPPSSLPPSFPPSSLPLSAPPAPPPPPPAPPLSSPSSSLPAPPPPPLPSPSLPSLNNNYSNEEGGSSIPLSPDGNLTASLSEQLANARLKRTATNETQSPAGPSASGGSTAGPTLSFQEEMQAKLNRRQKMTETVKKDEASPPGPPPPPPAAPSPAAPVLALKKEAPPPAAPKAKLPPPAVVAKAAVAAVPSEAINSALSGAVTLADLERVKGEIIEVLRSDITEVVSTRLDAMQAAIIAAMQEQLQALGNA